MSDRMGDVEAPETATTTGTDVEVTTAAEDVARAMGEEEGGAVTEVTETSYCGQLGSACTGACIGLLLFFGSIGLLIYNEGRTVKRAKDLDEGREVVVELNLDSYNTTSSIPKDMFANQLVHTVGELNTNDILVDPVFGVGGGNGTGAGGKSLKLSRSVEMYQWKENKKTSTRKTSSGSTITTTSYSYSKRWLDYTENSNNFHNSKYRDTNPTDFPFPELLLTADPIFLGNGGIQLSPEAAGRLNWYEPINSVSLETVVDSSLRSRLEVFDSNGFYYHALANDGTSTSTSTGVNDPVIGDARFTFQHMPTDTISIVAVYLPQQADDSAVVDAYTTSRGGTLLLVKRGNYTAEEMFQQEDEVNTTLAWILRFVGFFLMVVSILLILQPLATAVDIIPFVGDYLQGGLEGCIFPCIAVLIALPVSLFTIALAWLAYRPAWSVPILVVSGGIIVWLYCRAKRAKQDAEENNNNNNDDGMVKPPHNNSYINSEAAATSSYPYGSVGTYENNNNSNTASTGIVASSLMGGGFAGALDNPPPTAPQPPPATAVPIVEPDVVMGQPYYSDPSQGAYSSNNDVESNYNKPFVPQVYKP